MNWRGSFFILGLLLLGLVRPASAEIVYGNQGREWTLLRANVDFTLIHPLKILHGHLGDIVGSVKVDPAAVAGGMFLAIHGNTGKISFDEPQGSRILNWAGNPMDWNLVVYTVIHRRHEGESDYFDLIGNWGVGGKKIVYNVPVRCQADEDVFHCNVGTTGSFKAMGWDRPMMMFFPVDDKFEVSGELTFGEKGAGG